MKARALVAVMGLLALPAHADIATPFSYGTALPASCAVPQLFLDTDAPTGQQFYACEAGTFVLQRIACTESSPGNLVCTSLSTTDRTTEPGNKSSVYDNDTAFTLDPTCANSGTAGELTLIDSDETSAERWDVCDGTALRFRFPTVSTTTTEALFATATSGAPAFRAVAVGDLPTTGYALGASTATSPSADDSDTSLATSAFVQGEINGAGGRSLTCASGVCDVDAEAYTRTWEIALEAPSDTDDFLFARAGVALTLTRVDCVAQGGASPSFPITILECDTSGTGCSTTGGVVTADGGLDSDTSFTDAAIAAGAWLQFLVGTSSGSAGWLTCVVTATLDD